MQGKPSSLLRTGRSRTEDSSGSAADRTVDKKGLAANEPTLLLASQRCKIHTSACLRQDQKARIEEGLPGTEMKLSLTCPFGVMTLFHHWQVTLGGGELSSCP